MQSPPPARSPMTAASSVDRLPAPPPGSERLTEASSSFEAQYAVLSEANARSAALEMMLRDSQPLLWLDSGLALRRRKDNASRHAKEARREVEKVHIEDVDDLELLMESDLRRRRRVQWEVAKRIARVEREITKLPTAQRSWHVRERKQREEEEKRRRQEEIQREKERKQNETAARLKRERERKMVSNRELSQRHEILHTPLDAQKKLMTAPTEGELQQKSDVHLDVKFDPSVGLRQSPTSTGNIVEPLKSLQKKENTVPYPPPVATQAEEKSVNSRDTPFRTANESTEGNARTDHISSLQTCSNCDIAPEHEEYVSLDTDAPSKQVPVTGKDQGDFIPSSLGRQVLSDYRTVPTPVSFGPLAVTGPRTHRKLNGDVIRRLFNDLDTDRDGHLNRVETSIALHRLQLNVHAPRVIAFFKRIHSNEKNSHRGSMNSRMNATRQGPLSELINYQQFAAFVSMAFDQQQLDQPKSRKDKCGQLINSRNNISSSDSSLMKNSSPNRTSQPSLVVPLLDGSALVDKQVSLDWEEGDAGRRRIELPEEEDTAARILSQIPDCLTMQVLSAMESQSDMQQLVRRSLERVSADLDNSVVESVTRKLVEQCAHNFLVNGVPRGEQLDDEGLEDISGLRGAGTLFEALGSYCETPHTGEEAELTMNEWWSELTEEQISALIQEIWRAREQTITIPVANEDCRPLPSENVDSRPLPDKLEEKHVSLELRKSTHDEELMPRSRVLRVAEKAVQTRSIELTVISITTSSSPSPPPPPPPPLPPSPPVTPCLPQLGPTNPTQPPILQPETLPSQPHVRTALARAILGTDEPSRASPLSQRREDLELDRTAAKVADLRRQRRHRRVTESTSKSDASDNSAISSVSVKSENLLTQPEAFQCRETPSKSTNDSPLGGDSFLNSIDPTSSIPVSEVHIQPALTPASPIQGSRSNRASYSSDDVLSYSSSLASSINLFREFGGEDTWLNASRRRRERLKRRSQLAREKKRKDTVESFGPNDDGEMSEGEIRRLSDLSDGELFGPTRQKVVRVKNHRVADDFSRESVNEPIRTSDSLESGEMLPRVVQFQPYRQQVFKSNASSLESGEAEEGVVEDDSSS